MKKHREAIRLAKNSPEIAAVYWTDGTVHNPKARHVYMRATNRGLSPEFYVGAKKIGEWTHTSEDEQYTVKDYELLWERKQATLKDAIPYKTLFRIPSATSRSKVWYAGEDAEHPRNSRWVICDHPHCSEATILNNTTPIEIVQEEVVTPPERRVIQLADRNADIVVRLDRLGPEEPIRKHYEEAKGVYRFYLKKPEHPERVASWMIEIRAFAMGIGDEYVLAECWDDEPPLSENAVTIWKNQTL